MSLREHLGELRRRMVRSAIAIAIGAVVGWLLSDEVYRLLLNPVLQVQAEHSDTPISINFTNPVAAFNLQVQIAVVTGVILAAPVWLYQFWAFITPGLTRKERLYSYGFVGSALPLFLGGVALAWFVLPKALSFLNEFVPEGATQFVDAASFFSFVLRIVLAFGLAFVVPVVLVALNLAHLVSGRGMLRHWRIIVFASFLFAAVATPTPEVMSMVMLAGALCLLFALAIGLCLMLDRRRARRSPEPDYTAIADDEASEL